MEKDMVKELAFNCVKKIKNGDESAHDEFLKKINAIREYEYKNFMAYAGTVFLMFEEWGLKEKIDAAQLKLMWDGANEVYMAELNKILESK